MKKITDKEYEEFQRYKDDVLHGRVITSDGLRLICEAEEKDPYRIGMHFLSIYYGKIKAHR